MKTPPQWKEEGNTIKRTYERKDFSDAVAFINQILPLAEEANHHPDITIHDYKKVTITLTTHEEGRVTNKDTELAARIDEKTI